MKNIKVIKNYAESLFDSAKKKHREEDIFLDIRNIIEVITTNNELKNILYSPIISKSNKIKLIEELATKLGTDKTLLKFLIMLVNNAREHVLDHLSDYYKLMLDTSKGIRQVKIKSHRMLDDSDRKILDKYLEAELTQNNIEIEFEVDSSLLGGILVQYDNKVIDLSVTGYLKKIDDVTRSAVIK